MSWSTGSPVRLPRTIPIISLPTLVLLPSNSTTVTLRDDLQSGKAADKYFWETDKLMSILGIVPLLADSDGPMENQKLNNIGTAARVTKITRLKRSGGPTIITLTLEGLCRFSIDNIVFQPQRVAKVTQLDMYDDEAAEDLVEQITNPDLVVSAEFKQAILELVSFLSAKQSVQSRLSTLISTLPLGVLCDMIASVIEASFDDKLKILNCIDITERCKICHELVNRQLVLLKMTQKIPDSISSKRGAKSNLVSETGRKLPLVTRTEPKAKRDVQQDEERINEDDDDADDTPENALEKLKQRIDSAKMPTDARRAARSEFRKVQEMEKTHNIGPEYQKAVTYLECIASLPWGISTASLSKPAIAGAKEILDRDHFGLEKIKQRILEYIAVRCLNPESRGTILCFVGPPGVGKTSLGKSIATTLGRKFHRIALGGVRDEADIRGFNRTYIGSQPGRIMQGLRRVGCNDPVFMLDEIDKLNRNSGVTGDPSAALLEVLDPAQNDSFSDHYVNIPFDLSKVIFIATANSKDTIPEALLDRMEVIDVVGYTTEEKTQIASIHLLPKLLKEHGLSQYDLVVPKQTLVAICERYTREPGVRTLERQIAAVCRAAAVRVLEKDRQKEKSEPIHVQPDHLQTILGPPFYQGEEDLASRVSHPGVAIGMAASQLGGSVMFVEVTQMPGSGQLVLTGNLGEIIKESARIALGWIKSHAEQARVPVSVMGKVDLHIHFPEGSVGKDGPSGGIALAVALVSCLSGRCVRADTAMTGEITLTGTVLPVGGVVQKVLAAYRRGVRRVVLPKHNFQYNVAELPADVRASMEFISASHIEDVLPHVFSSSSKL